MRTSAFARFKALPLAVAALLAGTLLAAAGPATAVPCTAGFICVPVSWEPLMTQPLTGPYLAPPVTTTTLVGVPFAMQNAFIFLGPGTSTVADSLLVARPTAVYLLINAANTPLATAGSTAGSVTLTFSNATTSTTDLVLGLNVREWKISAPATVNTVTSPANVPWWTGLSSDGMPAVIDMLTIAIPAGAPDLLSVTVTNSAPRISLLVSGLTVADPPLVTPPPPPAPAPAPDPPTRPSQKVEVCKAAPPTNGQHGIGACVSEAAHNANAARHEDRQANNAGTAADKHGDRKAGDSDALDRD